MGDCQMPLLCISLKVVKHVVFSFIKILQIHSHNCLTSKCAKYCMTPGRVGSHLVCGTYDNVKIFISII